MIFPVETLLLGLTKTMAGGKWYSGMGIEVFLEQGYRQFEPWMGRRCPRGVVPKMALAVYQVSG